MKDKIIKVIQKACAIKEDVTPESELKLLSLDSLSFVGAIVEIEKIFSVEFEIDELSVSDWKTVEDIIKGVEKKINEKK
ncbi:MAG TPA: D-alanine--poly(phosphoribitol) ligase subunit 2 [Clostridiales bacterium]|nr:D-alanine--poly(phosphoribitol) ligase subunit 2 [Clostridiales bacterium]